MTEAFVSSSNNRYSFRTSTVAEYGNWPTHQHSFTQKLASVAFVSAKFFPLACPERQRLREADELSEDDLANPLFQNNLKPKATFSTRQHIKLRHHKDEANVLASFESDFGVFGGHDYEDEEEEPEVLEHVETPVSACCAFKKSSGKASPFESTERGSVAESATWYRG